MRERNSAIGRRHLLGGAAAGLGVPLLAGCGSQARRDSDSAASGSTASPPGASASPGRATASASPTAASSTSAAKSEAPTGIVAATDVPVGGGVVLADDQVVVVQPRTGTFLGWSSTCTHQGCTVASVSDSLIHCPCHGSAFSIEDGSVRSGPATTALPKVALTVRGNQVHLG